MTSKELQLVQVVSELRAGPDLRADEFAAKHAAAINHVGFRISGGSVKFGRVMGGITYGHNAGHGMRSKKVGIGGGVIIVTDGKDNHLRVLLSQGDQRGQFLTAGAAPGGPEVQDDEVALVAAEAYGLRTVSDGEVWRGLAELLGFGAAVATGGGKQEHRQGGKRDDGTAWGGNANR